ncbi:sulfurtransferase TusA family protein [Alphaproteobacteria bacterium]|nr:sulfurtransferase TusA family protein [Alphaproteobacteria bacterium]
MSTYDYRGLKCPIPVIKAFKEIKNTPTEQSYQFKCDDDTAPKDFRDLCANTGLKLAKVIKKKSYYLILIERT